MDRRAFLRFAPPAPSAPLDEPVLPDAPNPFPAGHPLFARLPRPVPAARPSSFKGGPAQPLAIQAGLETYQAALDRPQATHLLRRLDLGAHPDQVAALDGMDTATAVDQLVDAGLAALTVPLPEPAWLNEPVPPRGSPPRVIDAYVDANNDEWLPELFIGWMQRLVGGGLHERMTLFWHNHFVTELEGYFRLAVYGHRYLNTLRTHALGNFKTFVHAIGQEAAMLYYLNGTLNNVNDPNENYARELLELFTMGQLDAQGNENYTQEDIQEIARALTGFVADPFTLTVQFVSIFHDNGQKTIFGRTGAWGYDDVIDLLFEERPAQIAAFVCRKLYRAFVYAEPDEAVVAELADVFVANNFEVAPVLRALFKSAHFHDAQVVGAQIKSPTLMLTGLMRELDVQNPPENLFLILFFVSLLLEQYLLSPPNVAGWEGHHTWLNTSTMAGRWLYTGFLVYGGNRNETPLNLVPISEKVLAAMDEPLDPSDPASAFALPVALAEHLLAVPLDALEIFAPNDDFAGDLINNPLPPGVLTGPAYARDLAKLFLAGVPWYEWNLYRPEAPFLLLAYTRYLLLLPEFQLA